MSKIVENDKNLLKEALAEYNAIKEEAIKIAKNRLADSMPDVIENFLKEELEKSMTDEGVVSTEDTMIDDQESSAMETMKDVDEPVVSEDEDMENMESIEEDEELTAEAIEEALREIENMDIEGEETDLDEHDISFEVDFDDENLELSNIRSDEKEFDDITLDLNDSDVSDDMGDSGEGMGDDTEFSDDDELEIVDDEDSTEGMGDDSGVSDDMGDIDFDSLDDEDEMEESLSHTITHDNAKGAGSHNHVNYEKAKRLRPAMKESAMKKDIEKLIKENQELKSINTDFKEALKKYKTQLYEMAVFNANLSHVNNLFVEHSTTVNEKKEILGKFKSVSTIEESKKTYNDFVKTLNESKKSKKTIEEIVEKPSNGDSGSQKLNESLGKQNETDGVKAIKYMMNYIENKRK